MKNLTKIFMAVVAGMFAFSCVTDTTTEPTVELGKVKTTIDLSFEGVKTHLGDKNGTQYPLLWSTGDQIAVNGIASEPLAEEFDGKAGASFEIESETELTYPRSIVYPAPAEGTGVTFPATQEYKAGNIADGVAPLYGYAAEAGDIITLQHLTGVLRFAVTGEATLASMTVKAATGALAGSYDIDCATGALTAQDGKTSSEISMSFGDGLALTETAQPIYIAVPAGKYGIIEATLTTTDGKKMAVKFDTEATPIKAGVVREFKEFIFGENVIEGDVFEIWDIEDLKMFAKTAVSFPWKEAKLMAAIDMTGEAWTPIDSFAKVFDGNRGEEDAIYIKGLAAPLFGTTSAEIKNLKLIDVNLTITDRTYAGSIACTMESTEAATAKLINCEAVGKIDYKNNAVTCETPFDPTLINVGGLVGRAYGATFQNCTNSVAITDLLSTPAGVAKYCSPSFGGIVGLTVEAKSGSAITTISYCNNYGALEMKDSKAAQTYSSPCVGGIIGCEYGLTSKNAVIEWCNNYAPIAQNSTGRQPDLGGIVGRCYAKKVDNCINHEDGDISFSQIGRYAFFGGIIGEVFGTTISNCTNKGDVVYAPTAIYNGAYQYQGGIVGVCQNSALTIDSCINEGAIKNLANEYNTKGGNGFVYVGGMIGYAKEETTITKCENKGEITIAGIKGNTETKDTAHCCVGGMIGYAAVSGSAVSESKNNGAINYNVQIYGQGSHAHHRVGGIVGRNEGAVLTSCENLKPININTTFLAVEGQEPHMSLQVGGLCGFCTVNVTNCVNKGNIVFGENATITSFHIGGMVGYMSSGTMKDSHNEGQVKILGNPTVTSDGQVGLHVGGLCGYSNGTLNNSYNGVENDTEKGKIIVKGKMYPAATWGGLLSSTTIGGLAGVVQGGVPVTSHNYAPMEITLQNTKEEVKYTATTTLLIGGLVGYTGKAWSNCSNKGNITVDGTTDYALRLAGCICRNGKSDHTNVDNYGNITIKNLNGVSCNIGGIDTAIGACKSLKNCDNSGSITIESTASFSGDVIVGGLTPSHNGEVDGYVSCTNSGTVNVSAQVAGYACAGGITGLMNASRKITSCSNSGTIMIDGIITGDASIGGCLAHTNSKDGFVIDDFTNTSAAVVKLGPNAVVTGAVNAGGIIGNWIKFAATGGGVMNSTSSGLIGAYGTGKGNVILGGIGGSCNAKNQYVKNCLFDGHIEANATGDAIIEDGYFGGLSGSQSSNVAIVEGFTSTGTITIKGKVRDICRIGGVVGSNTQSPAAWTGIVSAAMINFEAKAGDYKPDNTYIGGVIGNGGKNLTGAKSYCEIKAIGINSGAHIGMVMGSPRGTSVIAKNCQVGGRIATTESEKKTWDDDAEDYIVAVTPDWIELDGTNYFSYIYGGKTDWSGVTPAYDGCSWLSEKPTVSAQ